MLVHESNLITKMRMSKWVCDIFDRDPITEKYN